MEPIDRMMESWEKVKKTQISSHGKIIQSKKKFRI